MRRIRQTYRIKAPVARVWQALVDPKVIDRWGGGPARMSARVGAAFSLWGGEIHGKNSEVVKESKLAQDWVSGDWPKPSQLVFTLKEDDGVTVVTLIHENVPEGKFEDIRQGWRDFYMGPIKQLLEKEEQAE